MKEECNGPRRCTPAAMLVALQILFSSRLISPVKSDPDPCGQWLWSFKHRWTGENNELFHLACGQMSQQSLRVVIYSTWMEWSLSWYHWETPVFMRCHANMAAVEKVCGVAFISTVSLEWRNFGYDRSKHSHTMGLIELDMEVLSGLVPLLHILFFNFCLLLYWPFPISAS